MVVFPVTRSIPMTMMKAAIFVEPNRIVLDDKPIPEVGPLDALVRVTAGGMTLEYKLDRWD